MGESLIDLTQTVGADDHYVAHPGGSPLNVAVGLARLGTAVCFAGTISTDALGMRTRRFLQDEGVDLRLSVPVPTRTTLALATLVEGQPHYSFYASPAPPGVFHPADAVADGEFSVVHAGSIGLLDADVYASAVKLFSRGDGVRTLDPNVRPGLVTDPERYRADIARLAAHATVVKLSAEDADFLAPDRPAAALAADYLSRGSTAVILTAAEQGATVHHASGSATVPVSGAPVVDTTGGGDAVTAAVISRLVAEGVPDDLHGWTRVLRFAMQAAGVCCSRPGGAEAMPTADDLAPPHQRLIVNERTAWQRK